MKPSHLMGVDDLDKVAPMFRALWEPGPDARPLCDLMSDAIVWTDEVPDLPPREWDVVRYVWNHRTRLIMGEPSEFGAYWERAGELFPEWVGFRPERCEPSEWLVRLYREWRAVSAEDERRSGREFGG